MATLANTFEGGSNGTTISAANSGGTSGDAFSSVTIDSSLTYTTASAAHGTVAALASGTSDAYVAWTSGLTGTSATAWARVYLRFASLPASNTNILRMLSSSNGIMGTVRINSNGTLGMLWGTGSLGGTTTGTVTLGAWFRVEVMVTAGTGSTGTMTMRVYWTPDATTPDQTITSSNVATGASNPVRLRCGVLSNSAEVYFDDLAFSDVDWIGPAGGGGSTVTGTATATLGGVSATAAGIRSTAGTATASLGGLTAAAAGSSSSTVTGAASAALGALTGAATGTRRTPGTAAATLGALAAAAAGTRRTTGTAAATLGGLTATAHGTASGEITGTATATLGALTATAGGQRTTYGQAAATLGGLEATGAGRRLVHATGTAPLGGLTATIVQAGAGQQTGTATALLGGLAATAAARTRVRAHAAGTLGQLGATAQGQRTVHGHATAGTALTASATGRRRTYGQASGSLGGLIAAAAGRPRSHTQRRGLGRGIMVAHLLNRTLTVWRPSLTPDGSGGFDVDFDDVGEVRAKVDQPSTLERQRADQWGSEHTHNIYLEPDAQVFRGDELRGDDQVFRVLATVEPSYAVYLKAPAQLVQAEPDGAES